jgi:hypothetical protein
MTTDTESLIPILPAVFLADYLRSRYIKGDMARTAPRAIGYQFWHGGTCLRMAKIFADLMLLPNV